MKSLLIEGWRGIHLSIALVNQYQLLELARYADIRLKHSDLDFYADSWKDKDNRVAFPDHLNSTIASIPSPTEDETFDFAYRIGFPFDRPQHQAARRATFMVCESALSNIHLCFPDLGPEYFCARDDFIVTPSKWSKLKLLDFGFDETKIKVIPHGVSDEIFYPVTRDERQVIRDSLEISRPEFVFLNVGTGIFNKGLDILIAAFDLVRQYNDNARLMLKDAPDLYGMSLLDFFQRFEGLNGTLSEKTRNSIYMMPSKLEFSDMRLLYGAADCYASPYRAEGFNLPVMEAIACGLPVIVTEGGATDDFCQAGVARKVAAKRVMNSERPELFRGKILPGHHLEPSVESLAEQMQIAIDANLSSTAEFRKERHLLLEEFSWREVSRKLHDAFFS